jgi:hypothetical protein
MMPQDLFIPLLIAHLIGDFILQSDEWVSHKEINKFRSTYLYVHVMIHGGLAALFIWNSEYWMVPLLLIPVHYMIDLTKLMFQKEKNKTTWFFTDQALHVVSIWLLAAVFGKGQFYPAFLGYFGEMIWIYLIGIIFLTLPASVMISKVINPWAQQIGDRSDDSLENAGKYIGMLERIFVFIFILAGRWEAVGFLLTAKSVFRFGDLRESKDRKLTEYILLGTLISFGIAMITALIVTFCVINSKI